MLQSAVPAGGRSDIEPFRWGHIFLGPPSEWLVRGWGLLLIFICVYIYIYMCVVFDLRYCKIYIHIYIYIHINIYTHIYIYYIILYYIILNYIYIWVKTMCPNNWMVPTC